MITINKQNDTKANYITMVKTIEAFIAEETDIIANLANISSIINAYIEGLNWVGFYILKEGDLVLGPFQGLPACIRIKPGKGVCFKAVELKAAVIVDDVHSFEGHIACDPNSKSELVVPIFKNGEVYGVLDLDSPHPSRFTPLEEEYMTKVSNIISNKLNNFIS